MKLLRAVTSASRWIASLSLCALATSCITTVDPGLVAHRQGAYVTGMGVYTQLSDKDLDGRTALFAPGTTAVGLMPEHDNAAGFGLGFGFRGERDAIEFNWVQSEHDAELGTMSFDSTLDIFALEGKHFWRVQSKLQPYFLLGVVLPHLDIKNGATDGTDISDGRFQGLGMHIGGGFAWFLSERISLDFEGLYRWAYFDEFRGGGVSREIDDDLDASGITARAGLTYSF